MKIRLSDIAAETGFSVNTVSRALKGDKRISEGTRELIRQKADELGYIQNFLAKSMRTNHSRTLGIISADSSNPYFAEVILGIEEEARSHDYSILLINTEEQEENEYEAIRLMLGHQVDGLVVIPVFHSEKNRTIYKSLSVPVIFAGRRVEGMEEHSILQSDTEGSMEVFSYLLGKGHRQILYLAGPAGISNTEDRLQGLYNAFEKQGTPVDENLIVSTTGHIDDGYSVINRFLNKGVDFTAVSCFNDLIAMGVLKSLHENSLNVPGDVEVIGYDNLFMSQYMQPRLSSVDIPKAKLGQLAVKELIAHIKDENYPYKTIELEPRMVLRESTADTDK